MRVDTAMIQGEIYVDGIADLVPIWVKATWMSGIFCKDRSTALE